MPNSIILLTPEQLSTLLQLAIRTELRTLLSEQQQLTSDEILTSEEVTSLLKSSHCYLIKLRNKGLPQYWLDKSPPYSLY
jgi:hypothetical protein